MPPTAKKSVDQKQRLECPYNKTTLLWPPLLFDGRKLLSWRSNVKSQSVPRKVKNHKKLSKITTFWKILASVISDFSARHNTPTCAWSNCKTKKVDKFSKNCERGWLFSKSRFLTPPPPPPPQPALSLLTSIFGRCDLLDLSFSRHFGTACKVSSKVTGGVSRS